MSMLLKLIQWQPYYWGILVLFVVAFAPRLGDPWFSRVEKLGARLAGRKGLAIVSIFFLTIILRLALLGVLPINPPQVHDEFSYLLAADTFAHGRLANPPHPMGVFLDTFHVLQHPNYASMYPPAQGAVLALGLLLGHPWIGVLLSTAAMCAAIVWMLQGWLPAEWALLGGLLALLRFAILSYWANSYWGGSVAALGGALMIGALPRIRRNQRPRDVVLLALGAGILANSRPFEGLLLSIPVMVALCAWWLGRHSPSWKVMAPRVLLPLSSTLLVTASFMTYYNWRITGDPLLFPHALDDRIHRSTGNFIWQKATPPLPLVNTQFDAYYNHFERSLFNETRRDFWGFYSRKVMHIGSFLVGRDLLVQPFGALLLLPLLTLPWVLRDRRVRFLLAEFAFFLIGLLAAIWFEPHYAGPIIAVSVALLVQGLRHLRQWQLGGRSIGIGLTRAVVLSTVALIPICVAQTASHPDDDSSPLVRPREWAWDRARIAARLENMPGKQLVIVRYARGHNANLEWVSNRAEIDGAHVVWAREIPGVDIRPLLEYFADRNVWLLEPDVAPRRLALYSLPPQRRYPEYSGTNLKTMPADSATLQRP